MTASTTHVVVIPSYNTGHRVYDTVAAARAAWSPVWVVVDGSDDGTAAGLQALAAGDAGLRVFVLERNAGKGAAVLHGLQQARREGFSHALTMDSDGQHPAALIPSFMAASLARPEAMVLGRPVFDASAPLLRVREAGGMRRLERMQHGRALAGIAREHVDAQARVGRRELAQQMGAAVVAAVDDHPHRRPGPARVLHRLRDERPGVVARNDDQMRRAGRRLGCAAHCRSSSAK